MGARDGSIGPRLLLDMLDAGGSPFTGGVLLKTVIYLANFFSSDIFCAYDQRYEIGGTQARQGGKTPPRH